MAEPTMILDTVKLNGVLSTVKISFGIELPKNRKVPDRNGVGYKISNRFSKSFIILLFSIINTMMKLHASFVSVNLLRDLNLNHKSTNPSNSRLETFVYVSGHPLSREVEIVSVWFKSVKFLSLRSKE